MSKDKTIKIRLTSEEHELLVRLAGNEGISAYIRSLLVPTKLEVVATKSKVVPTKAENVPTKQDKRKALSSVTVQHSPMCQCFMCRPSA